MADEESEKLDLATGGGDILSEKDRKLLEAFHALPVDPEIETADDLKKFMRKFSSLKKTTDSEKTEMKGVKKETMTGTEEIHEDGDKPVPAPRISLYQYPKISTFGGESGKGEVTYDCFKFEIEALVKQEDYTEKQILHGIRKAAKGEVSEILRRLGTDVSVADVMKRLDSTYGNIETRETIMKRFYNCEQKDKETAMKFASRLEEYFDKAVHLGVVKKTDFDILKGVLYQGLKSDLRNLTTYKHDTITDYEEFKIEVRKLEAQLEATTKDEKGKPCKPIVSDPIVKDSSRPSQDNETTELLKQISARLDQLEAAQKSMNSGQQYRPYIPRSARRGHRFAPRGNRGRGSYRPERPLGSNTFITTCWRCNEKGHLQSNCPN